MSSEVRNSHRPLSARFGDSETSVALNFLALLLSAAVTALAAATEYFSPVELFLVLCGSLLATTVALETLVHYPTCALSRLNVRRVLSWHRVACREVALLVTLGSIAFVYWLFPRFFDEGMLNHYLPFLKIFVPVIVAGSLPYFALMDVVDDEEEDVTCRIGRAILTLRPTVTRFELANYVRSWIVKAFWLSLMQPAMVEKIKVFLCYNWNHLSGSPIQVYAMANTVCYAIDLCYASCGYALNFKLVNTHTRTAEPTFAGWVAGIGCYWPFWAILVWPYFLKYDMTSELVSIFPPGSAAWWVWAAAIVACELVYALSTVSAGIRFSNLTYRGLWNTGPYRWTKHPAYVFKNLSWWLMSTPFLINSGSDAVRCTFLLVLVNLVYFWRARTEERHLSHYPEYVAYALRMNERSIFRWVAKLLPFLAYRPPREGDLLFKTISDTSCTTKENK